MKDHKRRKLIPSAGFGLGRVEENLVEEADALTALLTTRIKNTRRGKR